MSSFIVKWVANRFLKDNQLNKLGVEDPYYEYVPLRHDKNGKVTKHKKVARRVPNGISENDITVLLDVRRQAYRYDMWFSLLGMKFGWSNVVGLVPVAGALISNYWSIRIYLLARKLDDGLPLDIQLIFFFNILVDFLLSLIPFVGDLIEIGYKANLRNFLLLEKHLVRVGEKNLGIIREEDVRPGFINDKVQPFVEETIVPGAKKAGGQIRPFVEETIVPGAKLAGAQIKNLVNRNKQPTTAPTTQSTGAVATATLEKDDDTRSIRSLHEHSRRALTSEWEQRHELIAREKRELTYILACIMSMWTHKPSEPVKTTVVKKIVTEIENWKYSPVHISNSYWLDYYQQRSYNLGQMAFIVSGSSSFQLKVISKV